MARGRAPRRASAGCRSDWPLLFPGRGSRTGGGGVSGVGLAMVRRYAVRGYWPWLLILHDAIVKPCHLAFWHLQDIFIPHPTRLRM